jgi:arabinofuranosyltransferase
MSTAGESTEGTPTDPAGQRSGVGIAVMLASVVGFLLLCFRLRTFFTDDAWISVRYAESVANGFGFVWNPGGEAAEGFSNPLLVYAEALAHLVNLSAVTFARVLGVVSAVACIVLVYWRGREVVGETAARAAAVLTGFCPPLALWAVGGLETTVTALVVTAATVELAKRDGGRPLLAGVLLALLPWLRPEGIAVALALAVLGEGLGVLRGSSRRRSLVRLALIAGPPVLSQVVLEVLRLTVYGHLLPNSVIYKSGVGALFLVPGKFLAQASAILALAAIGLIAARDRRWLLVVPTAVYLLGSIGTGDLVNAASRFFLPTWPLLTLVAGLGVATAVAAVPGRRGALAATAAVGVCALVAVTVQPGNVRLLGDFVHEYRVCREAPRAEVARWLRTNTPQDAVISISDAGLVPARSGGRTFVDQFLLNEPILQETGVQGPRARAKIVFARDPDFIVLASGSPKSFRRLYGTDSAIYRQPQMADYALVHVAKGRGCPYNLFIFGKRS